MNTRAAVAFVPKQPLEIVEVDMECPRAGEVLVEIMATGRAWAQWSTRRKSAPEIDPMITRVLQLGEINKAFDLMHAGESIRSVVVF